jgi:hypothetical protein
MGSYENYAQDIETNEEHDFSIKRTSVKNFKEMEKDWRKYLSLFRSKPDLFLDMILDPSSPFILFFYQRLILRIMFRYRVTFFVLARGSSKSFLQILALYLRCVFYPKIKLTITAPQKQMASGISQANIEAIWDFFPILKKEVKEIRFEKDYTRLTFWNGARFDCVALAESSRGLRRHGLSVEEIIHERFDKDVLNSVIMPILANNRIAMCGGECPYEISKPVTYVTTAGAKQTYAFEKHMEVMKDMVEGKSAFCLGASFDLPVMHQLLSAQYIQDLREDSTFNLLSWEREYASIWSGTSENSLVSLEDVRQSRTISKAEDKATDKKAMYVLSYDVSRSEGNQNALSSLAVFKCIDRGDGSYQKFLVNLYSMEGTHFRNQAIFLKQKVNDFNAEILICDANGIGAGVIDYLITECDSNPAYSVVNDSRYDRYKLQNSIPMVYCIKSQSKETNASDIHNIFINAIAHHQVKFLQTEHQVRTKLKKKEADEISQILRPYVETDFFQEELMNLEYYQSGTNTKVKQISKNIGKDRFSAVEYGLFWIVNKERQNKARRENIVDISDFFLGRKAKSKLEVVKKGDKYKSDKGKRK